MSLSTFLNNNQNTTHEARLHAQLSATINLLKADMKAMRDWQEAGGKPDRQPKTKGHYHAEHCMLIYTVFKGQTQKTDNYDTRRNQREQIIAKIKAELRESQHIKELHLACAEKDTDIRIEHTAWSDFEPNGMDDPYERITAAVTLSLREPYAKSSFKPHLSIKANINEANWPMTTLFPLAVAPSTKGAKLKGTEQNFDEDIALELAAEEAKREQVHIDAIKISAKALHKYVVQSFEQQMKPSLVDRLKRREVDQPLKEHIASLVNATRVLPGDKAAYEDFIAASTSAFWLGRAWHAGQEAAQAKNEKTRITAYVRMRDHLRAAWGVVMPESGQDLPYIMREAETMPAEVMRAVRARYDACWRSAAPDDVISGYVTQVVGLRTTLDTLRGAATTAFTAATQKQAERLAAKVARSERHLLQAAQR